jgi:hypothetical protein
VTPESPHGSLTHELIAGVAGFEAMRVYQKHREAEGIAGHHELGKELLAGFAAAECDKLFETKGLDFLDREQARRAAKEQAEHLFDRHHW